VMSSKIEEANAKLKEAEKFVTTGLFRWTPDYESGSATFETAGNLFRDAKEKPKAVIAFKRSGECYEKLNLPFKAATKYELAAQLAKDNKDSVTSLELYQKAALCFQMHGASDKASDVFLKAAKISEESGNLDRAIEICLQSIDVLESDNKYIFVVNSYRATTAMLVKNGRYEQAITLYRKQAGVHAKLNQTMDMGKCSLCLIVLHLLRDDYVGAEKEFRELAEDAPEFAVGDYGKAANLLLNAIEKKDAEGLQKCQQMQIFTFLDIEILRTIKKLSVGATPGTDQKQQQQLNSLA